MDAGLVSLMGVLLMSTLFSSGLASPSTVPAFMWSPHHDEIKEAVNYQTLSGKDLAKSVLSEGGWSNILFYSYTIFKCQTKKLQRSVDLALVFVGKELQSLDASGIKHADPAFVKLLKDSITISNFSMAFPYVYLSNNMETMESSFISGFMENCDRDLDGSNVAFLQSCSVEGENFEKLADLSSIHDYLVSRTEKRSNGQADLVVMCHGENFGLQSEREILLQLINSMVRSETKYAVLYISQPQYAQFSSYGGMHRILAEGNFGNKSVNSSSCDEVCQIKSSLLEGLLVGIVFLIILISGLCCMVGIDTPTRFEAPQDS